MNVYLNAPPIISIRIWCDPQDLVHHGIYWAKLMMVWDFSPFKSFGTGPIYQWQSLSHLQSIKLIRLWVKRKITTGICWSGLEFAVCQWLTSANICVEMIGKFRNYQMTALAIFVRFHVAEVADITAKTPTEASSNCFWWTAADLVPRILAKKFRSAHRWLNALTVCIFVTEMIM